MALHCAWIGKRRGLRWKFRRRSNGTITEGWKAGKTFTAETQRLPSDYWMDFRSILCVSAAYFFLRDQERLNVERIVSAIRATCCIAAGDISLLPPRSRRTSQIPGRWTNLSWQIAPV